LVRATAASLVAATKNDVPRRRATCSHGVVTADHDVSPAYGADRLAAVYDALNTWGSSDEFYLRHLMPAASVLDLGCGMLCRARVAGHRGDLVGVDPAAGMLAVARAKRDDVAWLRARAQALDLGRTFELVTMTGHAFQELLDDDDVRAVLAAVHRHLVPGGRFVFETRNPAARAWQRWTPGQTRATVRSPAGDEVVVWHDLRRVRPPDLVDYVTTFHWRGTGYTVTSASTLRFVDPVWLNTLCTDAGLRVDGWYGDWDRSAVTATSPEIIVVAARV